MAIDLLHDLGYNEDEARDARRLAHQTERADAAEDGLFRVVQALGFDMDGAKNADEFFGPMTYCTEDEWLTEPADIAVAYAADHRKEMEEEAERADEEIARLKRVIVEALDAIGSENAWDGHARADQLDDTRRVLRAAAVSDPQRRNGE